MHFNNLLKYLKKADTENKLPVWRIAPVSRNGTFNTKVIVQVINKRIV